MKKLRAAKKTGRRKKGGGIPSSRDRTFNVKKGKSWGTAFDFRGKSTADTGGTSTEGREHAYLISTQTVYIGGESQKDPRLERGEYSIG